MKRLYGLVLICFSFVATAQFSRNEFVLSSKGLLDFQAGVAVPVFDYGLSKLTLPAGYAQTGYTLKFGVSYDVLPYLGLAFQYQYSNNPFNAGKLLTDFQTLYNDPVFNSYRSNPWELRTTMVGLYYPFKSYRTSIDLRLLGGLCSAIYPENEMNVTYAQAPNNPENYKEFETSANALGFQTGIKMRYQLYKKIMLCLAADYTQAKIEFINIRGLETTQNVSYDVAAYTQKIQIVHLTAGVGISFE